MSRFDIYDICRFYDNGIIDNEEAEIENEKLMRNYEEYDEVEQSDIINDYDWGGLFEC